MRASLLLIASLAAVVAEGNEFVTRSDALTLDVAPSGDRIAMGLAGDIWVLPAQGGEATRLVDSNASLFGPRWSPRGTRLLYQSRSRDGDAIWVTDLASGESKRLGEQHRQDAAWHPDGERIVFAADQHGTGLDLWETDVATGLAWRMTRDPGDEYSPAWSANGRHLAFVRRVDDRYQLVLRRRNEAEQVVIESTEPLVAPSWRPDGSLITYQRHEEGGISLEMAILSEPVLVRVIDHYQQMPAAPISWRDRMSMVYVAEGLIRTRGFEDRVSRPLHFRALVAAAAPEPERVRDIVRRDIEPSDVPDGRLIIRGRRLFDGLWTGYRENMDIVLEAGRVSAVEPRRERADGTIIDLGDVVVMPGLVEADGRIDDSPKSGAAMLAYGITTLITEQTPDEFDAVAWETEATPGPRVIEVAADSISPSVQSLADASLPGIDRLLSSRQATFLGQTARPPRRFGERPSVNLDGSPVVVGGRSSQLPTGLSLHAELGALQAAGLDPEQALRAVTTNPARLAGLEYQAGAILPGALADLLLVRGDPLGDVSETLNIVAVVRNGRFFSMVSLLERAASTGNVE
jgi:hypothetical protein